MTSTAIKKGDKVLVYGSVCTSSSPTMASTFFLRGEPAKVTFICDDHEIVVKFKGQPGHRLKAGAEAEVHPKQCEVIKK